MYHVKTRETDKKTNKLMMETSERSLAQFQISCEKYLGRFEIWRNYVRFLSRLAKELRISKIFTAVS